MQGQGLGGSKFDQLFLGAQVQSCLVRSVSTCAICITQCEQISGLSSAETRILLDSVISLIVAARESHHAAAMRHNSRIIAQFLAICPGSSLSLEFWRVVLGHLARWATSLTYLAASPTLLVRLVVAEIAHLESAP
jgi:hypothetical protein